MTGKKLLLPTSASKAITILRQLSRNKTSVNQVTRLLNMAFNIVEEFKVVYRRIE